MILQSRRSKGFNISILDAVISQLCMVFRTAAFGDVAAKDMINVAVVPRVHACVLKEVAEVMDE